MKQKKYVNLIVVLLSLYILVTMLPICWIFITSLKPVAEIPINPYGLPKNPTLFNYKFLLLGEMFQTVAIAYDAPPFLPSVILTITVAGLCVAVSLILGMMVSYGLSRRKTGGTFLLFWFLSLLFAPPIIFAFPLYLMYQRLGLLDNVIGLAGANLTFDLPFAIWIFHSYLRDRPKEIEEAALIDGASTWIVLWKIVLPLMKPAATAVGALIFVFVWSEYLFSTVLMEYSKTITVALSSFRTGQMIFYGATAAGLMIALIPPMLVLVFFGKHLATGLSFGAIKG